MGEEGGDPAEGAARAEPVRPGSRTRSSLHVVGDEAGAGSKGPSTGLRMHVKEEGLQQGRLAGRFAAFSGRRALSGPRGSLALAGAP